MSSDKQLAEELAPLRQEVAQLDREILQLVARRLATTRRIGEAKNRAGLPIRDFRVEVEVLRRARKNAREFGFDHEVAEDLAELLMTAAVQTQAEIPQSVPSAGSKTVLVVGGGGRMGAWLARFFDAQGHSVKICDPGGGDGRFPAVSLQQGASDSEVVVLSTPLGSTVAVLEELFGLEADPLIFDICSLKSQVAPVLRRAASEGRRVTSLHPMFAPGAVLLHGRAVLICDAGQRAATEEARSLFADTALGLYEVGLEEHDKIMAVVLGMSHALNLQFADAVKAFGLPFELLGKIASTTFAKQIKTTAEVVEENPHLYHEIQHFNAFTPDMFRLLSESLTRLQQAAEGSQSQEFFELMKGGCQYFGSTAAG